MADERGIDKRTVKRLVEGSARSAAEISGTSCTKRRVQRCPPTRSYLVCFFIFTVTPPRSHCAIVQYVIDSSVNTMAAKQTKFKVAAAHAAPVFMNKAATIRKTIALIEQAAEDNVKLLVFPETFIPGYPVGH